MRIKEIKIYNLKIPFRLKVTHGLYTREHTEAIVVINHDDKGNKGYGEGTPRDFVTGESLNECLRAVKALSHKVIRKDIKSLDDLKYSLANLWM